MAVSLNVDLCRRKAQRAFQVKAAGIILAAGESRRMGQPKATLPLRGGTFLSILSKTFAELCSPVVAVFGAGAESLIARAPADVLAIENPSWQGGMLTSLQAGLRALPHDCDAVLFTLVDHPAVQPGTLRALLESATRTGKPIVIPRCDGRRGHPVAIRRSLFEEFSAEPRTSQVRDVVNRHAAEIEYVEVDDPGIFDDIDDPRLYQSLLAREADR